MQILILAAGYATRLYPLTKLCPKPLLLVKEKPIISHIIKSIEQLDNVEEIIVVTNNKFKHKFEHWAESCSYQSKISVISDQTDSENEKLGAIGDISYILNNHKIKDDLLVIGGDNLFSFDLNAFVNFAKKRKDSCTVGLHELKERNKVKFYGVATTNDLGHIVDFIEKPEKSDSFLISMCLYYFSKGSLGLIPEYLKTNNKDALGNYIKW